MKRKYKVTMTVIVEEDSKIHEEILELKNDILNLSSNDILYKNEFCHGNLKTSNILLRDSDIKFINFEITIKKRLCFFII